MIMRKVNNEQYNYKTSCLSTGAGDFMNVLR